MALIQNYITNQKMAVLVRDDFCMGDHCQKYLNGHISAKNEDIETGMARRHYNTYAEALFN